MQDGDCIAANKLRSLLFAKQQHKESFGKEEKDLSLELSIE